MGIKLTQIIIQFFCPIARKAVNFAHNRTPQSYKFYNKHFIIHFTYLFSRTIILQSLQFVKCFIKEQVILPLRQRNQTHSYGQNNKPTAKMST